MAIEDAYAYWSNRKQSFMSQINQIDIENKYSGIRKILLNIIAIRMILIICLKI